MSKIGIIAGGGNLPLRLIQKCQVQNTPFFVVGLKGQTDPNILSDIPHAWTYLGQTGRIIQTLKDEGVDRLVMAGGVRRPNILEIRPDIRTAKLFARLAKTGFGDDALLKGIAQELKDEGFEIIGAHEIDDSLLAPEGVLGKIAPRPEYMQDIDYGIKIAQTLGSLDVGQSVIVQQGITLGVEAVEGTDKLLLRCKDLKSKGQKPILVKMAKPQQDKRLDLPTIGERTVKNAYDAGLCGIVIMAGSCLILDKESLIKKADKRGLFILSVPAKTERNN